MDPISDKIPSSSGIAVSSLSMDNTDAGLDRIEEKKEIGQNDEKKVETTEAEAATTTAPVRRNRRVRKDLKKSMAKVHQSLADHEIKFLQGLLDDGTDQEIQTAQAALMDSALFFQDNANDKDSSKGNNNKKDSSKSSSSTTSPSDEASAVIASPDLQKSSSLGTDRRRERLQFRRTFAVYNQMWNAHEKGILTGGDNDGAVSRTRSAGDVGGGTDDVKNVPDVMRHSEKIPAAVDASTTAATATPAIGISRRRGSSRRLSSVTAAKVHRMSVTSSFARQSSLAGERRRSSILLPLQQQQLEPKEKENDIRSDISGTGKKSVGFSNDNHDEKKTVIPRKKSVSFATDESGTSDDKNASHLTVTTTTTALEQGVGEHEKRDGMKKSQGMVKERKSCLIKKKQEEQHVCESSNSNDQIKMMPQQDTAESYYCNIRGGGDCMPAFFRFFTRFRRVSISTDASNEEIRSIPQKEQTQEEDICSIPHEAPVRVRNRGDSFDETMTCERVGAVLVRQRSSHRMKRTFSDDMLNSTTIRSSHVVISSEEPNSKDDNEGDDDVLDYYDAWMSYMQGLDFDGSGCDNYTHLTSPSLDFCILGTSANDESALPHVLSPPLMQSLQAYLPWSKRGENFWLKYSMVRDGASIYSLLQLTRGAKHSVLAIETVDGDVFGVFCGQPWRKSTGGYYGSTETFVWKMKHTRKEKTRSVFDQAAMEREIVVYPYSHNNDFIQVCKSDYLSVGGGTGDTIDTYTLLPDFTDDQHIEYNDWGPAIHLSNDLLEGTSSPCLTFCSPALCPQHADGSLFEIINLEVWTLTPAISVAQAEQLECGRLFLQQNARFL